MGKTCYLAVAFPVVSLDCYTVGKIYFRKDCGKSLVTCFIPLLALADNNASCLKRTCIGFSLFIPRRTIVAGYYGFTLDVHVSVTHEGAVMDCIPSERTPSVRQSVVRPSVRISFPDDNLSKHQWIFTKLGMCIDVVETRFGIAYGQNSSMFDRVICPQQDNGEV